MTHSRHLTSTLLIVAHRGAHTSFTSSIHFSCRALKKKTALTFNCLCIWSAPVGGAPSCWDSSAGGRQCSKGCIRQSCGRGQASSAPKCDSGTSGGGNRGCAFVQRANNLQAALATQWTAHRYECRRSARPHTGKNWVQQASSISKPIFLQNAQALWQRRSISTSWDLQVMNKTSGASWGQFFSDMYQHGTLGWTKGRLCQKVRVWLGH